MKKLNTVYHVVMIGMIGYLGIANNLLIKKVRNIEQEVRIGTMMSNDANFKIESFMQIMATEHKNEIRAVLEEIFKEGTQ